jgi:amino acid permease
MTDEDFAMLSPDVASHSRSSSLLLPGHVADAIGTMPLLNLPRNNNNKHAARSASDPHILAGTSRTVFNIIKAFLGTAILFIPRGIRSAGLVAGAATLMTMAGLSTWAMLLLLRTRRHLETIGVGAGDRGSAPRVVFGYGHVARLTLGRGGQYAVEMAILLSQLGFCCVYFSFWGQMLSEVLVEFAGNNTGTGGSSSSGGAGSRSGSSFYFSEGAGGGGGGGGGGDGLPAWTSSRLTLGAICLALAVPLIWIRHLKYLAVGNFLSDIAIAFSLGYIVWVASTALSAGHAEQDWSCAAGGAEGGGGGGGGGRTGGGVPATGSRSEVGMASPSSSSSSSSFPSTGSLPTACFWINPSSFLMFAGTAVYSFEGIAMVLPIQNSMKRPQDLVQLLSLSMFGMSVLLASFGAFCFYVFGQNTANIVISNLPRGQPLTQATQIAYLFVAVVTVPMCLFPAIRIWERWVFTKQRHSGKKWQKNFLRTAAAVGCLFIGVYGGTQLDHLVSVIGGMFSTPLALVFPPLLHLTSRADPRPCAQAMDVVLIAFGVVAGVMATWVAVSSW